MDTNSDGPTTHSSAAASPSTGPGKYAPPAIRSIGTLEQLTLGASPDGTDGVGPGSAIAF